MSNKITIRNEKATDNKQVEAIIRKCFWNLYIPGANEHYLAHIMRGHEDFIPELDFVIELDGEIIGNIMYTRAKLVNENGKEKDILTFGPVCILPEHQRKGYGKKLIEYSFKRAIELGYDLVVIFGNPGNYVCHGFKSSKKYNVSLEDGIYPTAMLVKELKANALEAGKWVYHESSVFSIDEQAAVVFDDALEPMEKKHMPSQEEFYIYSHSTIE
ncbi:GNAT family N-acetyltransferase [Culicoidibacter larvae]|uniref:N-acetyltransferase n=1 Tax=Culicoidibacter larvae TaxID=2579976 RepID=A0A5R8QFC9_9FIRM|nr:N-acetyltransferase [Culicoidibacter larvae]TLG76715.1 N-acetyltransferase [Culicoidibacter larvae]